MVSVREVKLKWRNSDFSILRKRCIISKNTFLQTFSLITILVIRSIHFD